MAQIKLNSKKAKFKSIFPAITSIHGFYDLHRSGKSFWRIFWIIILAFAFVGVVLQIVQVVIHYINSPTITTFELKSAQTLPFPKVELCSSNVVNTSKVIESRFHPVVVSISLAWLPNFYRDTLYGYLTPNRQRGFSDQLYSQYIVATNTEKAKALSELKTFLEETGSPNSDPVVAATYAQLSFGLEFSYRLFLATAANQPPPLTPAEIAAAATATVPVTLEPVLAAGGKQIATLTTIEKALVLKLVQLVTIDQTTNGDDYATYKKEGYHTDPESFLFGLGYDQDKVLLSCHFRSELEDCQRYAKPVFDQTFGRCFLIDMERDQGAGGLGLTVLVDIHTELAWPYFPSAADGLSIRVQDQFNPVSYRTLHVPSGALAAILLRGQHFKLRNIIKDSCQDDMEREIITFPYSNLVCRLECYARVSWKHCNCILPISRQFLKNPDNLKYCSTPKESRCIFGVAAWVDEIRACSNKCLPKCQYWEYDPVVTYKRFPSTAMDQYAKSVGKDPTRWYRNFVLVSIAFEELQYIQILQSPSKTPDQLISEIGGCMGLFLGASLISIVQIFALIVHGCFGGNAKTGPVETAENGWTPGTEILYGYPEGGAIEAPPKVVLPPN